MIRIMGFFGSPWAWRRFFAGTISATILSITWIGRHAVKSWPSIAAGFTIAFSATVRHAVPLARRLSAFRIVRFMIGLWGTLALITAAAFVIASTYDPASLIRLAQDETRDTLGRELIVDGGLDFRLVPRPALVMHDVRLANADWGSRPDMLSVKHVALELDLMALAIGRVKMGRFFLVEPTIFLETDSNGHANWEMGSSDPDGGRSTDFNMRVEKLAIGGGRITFRNGETGDEKTLDLKSMTSSVSDDDSVAIMVRGRLGPRPLSADLTIMERGERFILSNLELQYGTSRLSGSGSLSFTGPRPLITATLDAPLIDVRGLDPNEAPPDGPEIENPEDARRDKTFLFRPIPLPLETLRMIDANAHIHAGRIILSDSLDDVRDATLSLDLKAGELSIDEFHGTAFGGQVDGTLELDANAQPAEFRAQAFATGMNYGQTLRTLGISETIEGTVHMRINVNGRGNSMREIASTLNGKTFLVAQDGVVNERILQVLSSGLLGILGSMEETPFTCAASRFRLRNGIATSRTLFIDGPSFGMHGTGTIDLRDESLNLSFKPESRALSVVKLDVPFSVGGTLRAPVAEADTGAGKIVAGFFEGMSDLVSKGLFGGGQNKKRRAMANAEKSCKKTLRAMGVSRRRMASAP